MTDPENEIECACMTTLTLAGEWQGSDSCPCENRATLGRSSRHLPHHSLCLRLCKLLQAAGCCKPGDACACGHCALLVLAGVAEMCTHNPTCAGFSITKTSTLGCANDKPTYCLKYTSLHPVPSAAMRDACDAFYARQDMLDSEDYKHNSNVRIVSNDGRCLATHEGEHNDCDCGGSPCDGR